MHNMHKQLLVNPIILEIKHMLKSILYWKTKFKHFQGRFKDL